MAAGNKRENPEEQTRSGIEALGEDFIEKWRQGLEPDVEQYALENPGLADQIRDMFPAMLFAEQINPTSFMPKYSQELELPAVLGGFNLIREIGRGGMAIVYEATQENFGGKLAVKVLQNHILRSQNLDDRFVREAEAASRLHHPNIVPPRQYGRDGEHHFLAMALIDGLSLDRLIHRSRSLAEQPKGSVTEQNPLNESNSDADMDGNVSKRAESDTDSTVAKNVSLDLVFHRIRTNWNAISELGAGIASALHHAHEHGTVHRDVKPANVIIDRQGKVWVTDFGLAKLRDENAELSRSGEMIGTPRYMAPEQLRGTADARSDIYGIGLTLYELVTGERPWDLFESKNLLVSRPMLQMPDVNSLNSEIPSELAGIIMKACEHHPEARYQTARELEFDLNQFAHKGQSNRRKAERSQSASTKMRISALVTALVIIFTWFFVKSEGLFQSIKSQAHELQTQNVSYSTDTAGQQSATSGEDLTRPKTNCIAYTDPESGLEHVITRVNARTDDAEEYGDGIVYLDSTDLEMTFDRSEQVIGLRFAGVQIPKDVKVKHAAISFTCDESDSGETTLVLHGIADSDPISFRPISHDVTSRSKTNSSVIWIPEPWTRGEKRSTSEIGVIVQELIDQQDWTSGNAMGFVISGDGLRSAKSFDSHTSRAPTLTIHYEK